MFANVCPTVSVRFPEPKLSVRFIRSRKRDDETFSEAVGRLTSERALLDFAEGDPVVEADEHRAALDAAEHEGTGATKRRLERLGVDAEE